METTANRNIVDKYLKKRAMIRLTPQAIGSAASQFMRHDFVNALTSIGDSNG